MQEIESKAGVDCTEENQSLADIFIEYFECYKNNYAINVDGKSYTYRELYCLASCIAHFLDKQDSEIFAILCDRNIYAYAAVLSAVLSGKIYLPLSSSYSEQKNLEVIEASKVCVLIIDQTFAGVAEKLLLEQKSKFHVLLVGYESVPNWVLQHNVMTLPKKYEPFFEVQSRKKISINANLYLLFTSGSTGKPKGVMISQRQVLYYVKNIISLFSPSERDRFSQVIDLTFDLSAHDMFVCWSSGACLCVFSGNNAIDLYRYIISNKVTFWLSVPSTAILLSQARLLKDGCFPHLRCSFFCGEPLSGNIASRWLAASCNGIVENFYGPTEATIAFTHYSFSGGEGIVLLGKPFSGLETVLIDENLQIVEPSKVGEICLSGVQVAAGYYNDAELTQQRFVKLNGSDVIWYRTGDLAVLDEFNNLIFKGRIDDQLQLRGCRIEKMELEVLLCRTLDIEELAIVPITNAEQVVDGYLAFVVGSALDIKEMFIRCQKNISKFLLPARIIKLELMPKMVNGKIDYANLYSKSKLLCT